jgi:hypothetical protein
MAQININVTAEFEQDLKKYMKVRGISEKSGAIRAAIHEAAERVGASSQPVSFSSWIGLATRAPMNPSPRFGNEDALWEND